ncbi:hypothetical protein BdWA1_000203 [Babesia duncani]|uniref:Uncharacterized protein n=1 Tax=Babesia duncani TaxID=323732 RepID=A0AAD9PLT1_9APIC|nr:hypothetical protein BdWA1_000203 [Babesia duncani]
MFSDTPSLGQIYQIDKFTFNDHDFNFESNEAFMSVNPDQVIVYACKDNSNNFYPWLLQLIGQSYDSSSTGYLNYFFKRHEDDVFKTHEFTRLTVQDGSIERKQDNLDQRLLESKPSLNTYISQLKTSASAAWYYVYKESYYSSSSVIQPYNLASYLQGDSDKKHKCGSGSVEHVVTSFSSSSETPKFEITFKGRQNKNTGEKNQEVTSIYHTDENKSKITQKGSPITTDLSGSGSSCKVNQAEQAVQSEGSGSNGSVGPGGTKVSKGVSEGGSETSSKGDSSPSSPSPAASQSSSSLPGIVCGAFIGFIALIGVGIFIYKRFG